MQATHDNISAKNLIECTFNDKINPSSILLLHIFGGFGQTGRYKGAKALAGGQD